MQDVVDDLKSEGYAIIRGFLSPDETAVIAAEVDKMYEEGLKHLSIELNVYAAMRSSVTRRLYAAE